MTHASKIDIIFLYICLYLFGIEPADFTQTVFFGFLGTFHEDGFFVGGTILAAASQAPLADVFGEEDAVFGFADFAVEFGLFVHGC